MPSGDDFLQAILANPDDDTLRLIYADWLEEHGDWARAEFIRLQCELATLPDRDPRVLQLRDRERELVEAHHQTWLGLFDNLLLFWRFRRGFIEEVSIDADQFLVHGEALFQFAPIRRVLFVNAGPRILALAQFPLLGKSPSIDFRYNQLGAHGVRHLVRSPHLQGVTALGLTGNGLRNVGALAVAQSPWLRELRILRLADNWIEEEGARALAASPYLTRLSLLDFRNNRCFSGNAELKRRYGAALSHLAAITCDPVYSAG